MNGVIPSSASIIDYGSTVSDQNKGVRPTSSSDLDTTGNIVSPREKLAKRLDAGRTVCAAMFGVGLALSCSGVAGLPGAILMAVGGLGWLLCSLGAVANLENKSPINVLKEMGHSLLSFFKGGAIGVFLVAWCIVGFPFAFGLAFVTEGAALNFWLRLFSSAARHTNIQELVPDSWRLGSQAT